MGNPAYYKMETPTMLPIEAPEFNVKERVYANQFESIPIQLITIWGAVMCGGHPSALQALIYCYLGFRVLYIVLYLAKVQPWRTLCFALSHLMTFSCGVLGCLSI